MGDKLSEQTTAACHADDLLFHREEHAYEHVLIYTVDIHKARILQPLELLRQERITIVRCASLHAFPYPLFRRLQPPHSCQPVVPVQILQIGRLTANLIDIDEQPRLSKQG